MGMIRYAGVFVCLLLGTHAHAQTPAADRYFDTWLLRRPLAQGSPGASDAMPIVQGGETRQIFPFTSFLRPDGANISLPTFRTNLGASVAGGIWPGSLGGTGVDNTGKIISLGDNLVTGGALTTTGIGPTTLAFPSSTATFTFPSSTAVLMDAAALNASLPSARTNLGASVSGGIWPGSLGGTGVDNTGKTLTLGGNVISTGTGPTTLAFPSSTATYTYPSASATLMDNAALNSSLPDARTNLGLGTASTPSFAALFLAATDPTGGPVFTVPSYGGWWHAQSIFDSIGTAAHAGETHATLLINRGTIGSGANGPGNADVGLFVTISKTDWLTSTVDGEMDGIFITSRQGLHGDSSAALGDVGKVRGGTAGMTGFEAALRWLDSSGNELMHIHPTVGMAPSTGDLANNTGHGFYAGNYGATVGGAANKIDPYSAFTSQDVDQWSNCPSNCSFWENVLVAAHTLNSPDLIYFKVNGGPTGAGDIMQGSGGSSVYGVATQSLGNRITTKNVGGEWRLYADDGTTVFKQTSQSLAGGGVVDRLSGPYPTSVWSDTGVDFAAGGLHRLVFSGGVGYWQTNTAAAGDFTTQVTPYSISTAGAMTLNSPNLVSPYLGVATAGGVLSNGAFRANGSESEQFQIANTGQEWRLNGQASASGGLFYLYDITNGRFPLNVAPNSTVSLTLGPTNATIAGGTLTGLPAPSAASDAVPKSYADSIAAGIVTHAAVAAATTANLAATASGTGPGKTLTNSGALAALVLDGHTVALNEDVLVKNQTLSQDNGIFKHTTLGTGAVAWVLTRRTDFDAASAAEVAPGASTIVINGTAWAASNWVETGQGPFTLETTPIVFSQVVGGSSSGTVNNCAVAGSVAYYAGAGTTVSCLTMGNNGVLITSAGGVPSINSTLPNAVQDLITRLNTVVVGVWNATAIGLSKGGTNTDLSGTGGAGQVLKQSSVGANITVATLSCADLSNDAASCATDTTNATNIASGTLAAARLPTFAHTQRTVAADAGTTNTTGLMMGLAGTITPTASGNVLISVCGDNKSAAVAGGVNTQLRTGTGAAPAVGAALTGTTRGSLAKYVAGTVASKARSCLKWTITGLTLNVALWIDVGRANNAGSILATFTAVDIVADEIP